MHVPDGFIAPQFYLPLYPVAGMAWWYGARRLRRGLDAEQLPRLALLGAATFALSSVMVPLPGGVSVHATGIAILATLFGLWTAFIALSLVLLLQALLIGGGGVTTLPLNALALGLCGSGTAIALYRLLRRWGEGPALFVAGWSSVNVAALLTALALGLQPLIAHDPQGQPLFFPFGIAVTVPAVVIPHLFSGIGEGLLTVAVVRWVRGRMGR